MVDVCAVVDAYDVNGAGVVVDAVDNPVGATAGGMIAGQFPCEWFADAVRVVQQCPGEELSDRASDREWQTDRWTFGERSASSGGEG